MNRRDFLKMTVTTTALAASHNIPAIGDPLDGPRRGNATTAIGRTTHPQPLVLGLGGVGTRVVQAFSTSRMGAKARILSLDDPVFSPPDKALWSPSQEYRPFVLGYGPGRQNRYPPCFAFRRGSRQAKGSYDCFGNASGSI